MASFIQSASLVKLNIHYRSYTVLTLVLTCQAFSLSYNTNILQDKNMKIDYKSNPQ